MVSRQLLLFLMADQTDAAQIETDVSAGAAVLLEEEGLARSGAKRIMVPIGPSRR